MLEKGKTYTVEEILQESNIDYKKDLGKVKCTIGGIRGCTQANKRIKIPESAEELTILFADKSETLELK